MDKQSESDRGTVGINDLPDEILQFVFVHLPLVDLLTLYSTVCKRWYRIISDSEFIPWKKRYSNFLSMRDPQSSTFMDQLCLAQNITSIENCLQGLLQYLIPANNSRSAETLHLVKINHSRGLFSEKLVRERFPNVPDQLLTWPLIGMITVTSSEVWEIDELFSILTSHKSEFTMKEVIEKFYCISTFFLYFARKFRMPIKLHYNVSYALHLFENCWNIPKPRMFRSTRPNDAVHLVKTTHALTHEQSRIVNHQFKKDHLIKIVAFAGSGKTTTLLRLTEKNRDTKFLLMVYNRCIAVDAASKFPSNVTSRTVHSLAYKHMQKRKLFATKQKTESIYISDLINETERVKVLQDRKGAPRYQRERMVIETLDRYWASADTEITVDHVPPVIISVRENVNHEEIVSDNEKRELVNDAKFIWSIMQDPKDMRVKKWPPDAYLKVWQLSKPNVFKLEKIDCFIIDEAQDMSGAMLDIFLAHRGPRVMVGDPNQQIYQWRYAINGLNVVSPTHTYYLTQSFRFGPQIGFMAQACLQVLNNINDRLIMGGKVHDSLGLTDSNGVNLNGPDQQVCYLARTNLKLFMKSVQVLGCDGQRSSQKPIPKISFVGGIEKLNFPALIDVVNLRRGNLGKIAHKFLQKFKSFEDFNKYVEKVNDKEWLSKISIAKWAGDRTEGYIESIRNCHVPMKEADVIFSTAHKAKGMEWDTVAILDDFVPSHSVNQPGDRNQEEEECNLLYVAVTRAKRKLIINPACYYTLLRVGERFETIVDTAAYTSQGISTTCCHCKELLPGKCEARTASLFTRPIKLMCVNFKELAVESGLLCAFCSGLPLYALPRFNCYENRTILDPVQLDMGHHTFRFLVGPAENDRKQAQELYDQLRGRSQQGRVDFVQGRQFLLRPQVVQHEPPIVLNQVPELFPEDDDVFLEAMAAGNEVEVVPLVNQREVVFPEDDFIFPGGDFVIQPPNLLVPEHFPNDDDIFPNLE